MIIEIIDVVREDKPNKNGKGTYGQLTVAYRADGKVGEKKIMSFANPAVFKSLENASKGQMFEVDSVKEGDYWQWKSIKQVDKETKPTETTVVTRPTSSTYETKEERAIKQRYIVRQSSLSIAKDLLSVGVKAPPNKEEVLALAEELVAWVFKPQDPFVDFQDDSIE